MSQVVRITSGEETVFVFGNTQSPTALVANGAIQDSLPLYKESPWSTFHGWLTTSAANFGLVTATIAIQGSNDPWAGIGFVLNNLVLTNASAVVTSARNEFAGGSEMLNDLPNPPVAVGMLVVGPGVPVGAYVATVTNNGSITLSTNVTGLPVSPTTGSVRFFTNNWATTALATLTLSATTSATVPFTSEGATSVSTFKYVRAHVTNITGTGAIVSVVMGV
jgi:hypothetical protein